LAPETYVDYFLITPITSTFFCLPVKNKAGYRPQPKSVRRSAVPLASRARCARTPPHPASCLATSGLNNSFFIYVPGP